MNFLIVDDMMVMRRNIAERLQELGHTSDQAKNIIQAKELEKTNKYDAIFLDIRIGEINGLDHIKSFNSKVIICSGNYSSSDIARAMNSGAVDFLCKPIDKTRLKHSIDTLSQRNPRCVNSLEW